MTDRQRSYYWPLGGFAALILVCYFSSLSGGFIWDDTQIYILNNRLLRASDGLFRFWFTREPADYYPLTYTTFWLEWRLWGAQPLGFRVVNLVLHFGVTAVLWRLLARLNVPGAWLAAAIFAVHPVNVETVAWITQRKSLLAALFGYAALWAYVDDCARPQRRLYLASLFCFALSLAAKPTLIALPLLLIGFDAWRGERFGKRDVARWAPYFLLAALFGLVGIWFQEKAIGDHDVRMQSAWGRLATAGWASWFYIYEALLPWNQMFIYPRWNIEASSALAWVPLLLLIGCLAWSWRRRESWGRPVLAGLGFFLITLLPALGFVDVYFWRYSLVADHYQYQSIIGVIALVVWAAHRLVRHLPAERTWPLRAGMAALLAGLSLLTWRYSHTFLDEGSVWSDTLRKNPNAIMAYANLATWYRDADQFDEAIEVVHRGMAVSDEPELHGLLADILRRMGKYAEAEHEYRIVRDRAPGLRQPLLGMAMTLNFLGKSSEAIPLLELAIQRKTDLPIAYRELGIAHCALGDHAGGQQAYLRALALDPAAAKVHLLLADSLRTSGNVRDAIEHYEAAADLQPQNALALAHLARAYAANNDPQRAYIAMAAALRLAPDDPTLQVEMGSLCANQGDMAGGKSHFQAAVRAAPKDPLPRLYLGRVLLLLGESQAAAAELHAAADLKPDSLAVLGQLAWMLATHHDPAIRDSRRALDLAERATRLSGEPDLLDIQAAAQASAGRTAEAAETAARAHQLALEAGKTALAAEIADRLKRYRAGEMYLAPAPPDGRP